MKLTLPSALWSIVVVGSLTWDGVRAADREDKQLALDDQQFWNRFLQRDRDNSIPPSVAPPSENPTLDVDIECIFSAAAEDCTEIQPPIPVCADGTAIDAVEFRMTIGRDCNPQGNDQGLQVFCEDLATPSSQEPVTVLCKNSANGADLVVEPSAVPSGGTFAVKPVAGETTLPKAIDCIYVDAAGVRIQQNIIDTSGNVQLNLSDEFGAFTLLACGSGTDLQSCLVELGFPVRLTNEGRVTMDITDVDFTFNDETRSLIGELDNPLLAPGSSTTILAQIEADICTGEPLCAEITVVAELPTGETVEGIDETCFEVPSLAPTAPTPPISAPPPSTTPPPVEEETSAPPVSPPAPVPAPVPITVPPPVPVPVDVPPVSSPVATPATPPAPIPLSVPVTPTVPDTIPSPVPPPMTPSVPIAIQPPVSPPVTVPPPVPVSLPPPVTVTPPVTPPVPSPVSPPVSPPVTPPVPPPVSPPVTPPVPSPVSLPVTPPVTPPVSIPASPPVTPPVTPPVPMVTPPVTLPVSIPASPPVTPPVTPPVPIPVSPQVTPPVTPPVPILVSPPVSPVAVGGGCELGVSLVCATANSQDCATIRPPSSRACVTAAPINVLTFSYQECDCLCASNSQGDASTCVDFAPLPEEPAIIDCSSADGTRLVVSPQPVIPGGTFTVSSASGPLPGTINCIISVNDITLQQNLITTTGDVSLLLGEAFGAMKVEGCDALSCKGILTYSIEIENSGDAPATMTVADFTLNGNSLSLLERIERNPLAAGSSTTTDVSVEVGICDGGTYAAAIAAEGSSPNGGICLAGEEFTFSLSRLPPTPSTPRPPQLSPMVSSPAVTAPAPVAVSVPSPVLVAAPVPLPVAVPVPVPIPVALPVAFPVAVPVAIPVAVPIALPVAIPVAVPVALPVAVPVAVTVPAAVPTLVQVPVSVPTPVATLPAPVTTPVAAIAPVPVVIPPGQCGIVIQAECVVIGDASTSGQPCVAEVIGIEPCLERPTDATMLFTGGDCSRSDNQQTSRFACVDSNGGPPTTVGQQSFISVTDIRGLGITYFSGLVAVGDQFRLNDGGNLFETDMFVNIFSTDRSTLLQTVQFHTSCETALELNDRFGATQLTQFVNEIQGTVTTFVEVSFNVKLLLPPNTVGGEVTLTSLLANTNFANTIDLTDQVLGQAIGPGETVTVELTGIIDSSVRRTYTIAFEARGTLSPSGAVCPGSDSLSFTAGNVAGARAPVPSPTSSGKGGGKGSNGSSSGKGSGKGMRSRK